jgi:hypothetical protein
MQELRIVNVPQPLSDKINSLYNESNYADRSAFLVHVLEDYCQYHDRYFFHCLPDTIRILSEDTLKQNSKRTQDILEYALKTTDQCNKLMKQLVDVLSGEDDDEEDEESDNIDFS